MDCTDEELYSMREKRDIDKLIAECSKSNYRVTFYGKDKEIVEEALKLYKSEKSEGKNELS